MSQFDLPPVENKVNEQSELFKKTLSDIEVAVRSISTPIESNAEAKSSALATILKLQNYDSPYPADKEMLISELSQHVAFIGAESDPASKDAKLKAVELILGLKETK